MQNLFNRLFPEQSIAAKISTNATPESPKMHWQNHTLMRGTVAHQVHLRRDQATTQIVVATSKRQEVAEAGEVVVEVGMDKTV